MKISKISSNKPSAVIIKGNPKYIDSQMANDFYNEISQYLEDKGCSVKFDAGEPYTEPPKADIWIGHSRGADRLRFAPENTITINIGNDDGIFHPKDNVDDDLPPNKYHFVFTNNMKKELDDAIEKVLK
jgi:hypothetical protein